jgi:hypothetical protein
MPLASITFQPGLSGSDSMASNSPGVALACWPRSGFRPRPFIKLAYGHNPRRSGGVTLLTLRMALALPVFLIIAQRRNATPL